MDAERLRERLERVRERIDRARARAGRTDEVGIVAVTKTHPAEAVEAALSVGLRRIGENRVQELEAKVSAVGRGRAEWHLIGHLQRNKVRRAIELFDLVHSIDSLRLAEELSREAERSGRTVEGLIQVNTSGERSKHGFAAEEAVEAAGRVVALPGVRAVGVMTMAPFTEDEEVIRGTFGRARALHERLAREVPGYEARHLSMGMSNDYEVAVEEGSTLVRLGTILFGERNA